MIESELFGHEAVGVHGGHRAATGCFELADGGTLFLDEIAEMDNSTQAKLLRVLQEGQLRRVGGGKTEIQVDVRSSRPQTRIPTDALCRDSCAEDLFYASIFAIALPALRERKEDITLLARTFIDEFNRQDNRQIRGFTPEAERTLERYHWPGNVREVRNVVQRAVVLGGTRLIDVEHFPDNVVRAAAPSAVPVSTGVTPIREMEREMIMRALEETGQDKRRAAALLGISLKTLTTSGKIRHPGGEVGAHHLMRHLGTTSTASSTSAGASELRGRCTSRS